MEKVSKIEFHRSGLTDAFMKNNSPNFYSFLNLLNSSSKPLHFLWMRNEKLCNLNILLLISTIIIYFYNNRTRNIARDNSSKLAINYG